MRVDFLSSQGGERVHALLLAAMFVLATAFAAPPASAQTGPLGCDAGEIKIRFSHVVVAEGHPKGEAAMALAEAVNSELDGRACMEVFPNSALFTDDQVMQALLDGEVELAAPSLSKLEPFTQRFRIFDLPFLFKDFQAVQWFQNSGTGARLRRSLIEKGFRALAFWNNGMKQMSASRALLIPGDARDLTFRIQSSEVIARQFAAVGARTLPLPFRDVRDALSDGRVQGQENSWSNIHSKGFYEFQDGVTETNHGVLAYIVVTSDKFWNGLPDDVRRDVTRILLRVSFEANERAYQINRRARAALIELGVPVRKLTDEQRAAWVDAMRPVWDAFGDDIGREAIRAAERASR